ncbi:tetratricopeptide repeat protein [Actinomadura verrucosospora]
MHRVPAAAGLTVGLGTYAGFAAQVPPSAGAGPLALGLFSSLVTGGGTYLGLLHERTRRLPPAGEPGEPAPPRRTVAVSYHPADSAYAEWVAAAVSLATPAHVEMRPWGSPPAAPDGETWELVVHSSTSEIVQRGDESQSDGRDGARRIEVRVDSCAGDAEADAIDIEGMAESAACAVIVRGLAARGALDAAAPAPGPDRRPSRHGVRFPGDGPRVSNLPPPDPGFVDRDDLTRRVRAALTRGHAPDGATAVALWGLGGVGKTALAAEYAHRYGGCYDIVWWLNAESAVELRHGLLGLAAALGVREQPDADRVVAELWRTLRGDDRWLLVYDNADADAAPGAGGSPVQHWPAGRAGHVVFTSARSDWGGLIDPGGRVEVRPMAPATAERFLREGTGDDDPEAAREIARVLGGLPLALAHAAAYCRQAAVPLRTYRRLLDDSLGRVLSRFRPDDRVQPVSMTWNLLLARAGEQLPAALDLMRLWAMLAPVGIPRDLLDPAVPLPGGLAHLADDLVEHDLAVQRLARYSLVTAEVGRLHVHRLVQTAVRLDTESAEEWLEAAVALLDRRFPRDVADSGRWGTCAELLPHVLAVQARHREQGDGEDRPPSRTERALGDLLHRAGSYLIERAGYAEAREPLETALALRERAYGRGSPQWAETKLRQGVLLYRLADLAAARTAMDTALRVREETAGPDDPALFPFLVWRCRLLIEFSELGEARRAAERARRILESAGVPRADLRRVEVDDLRCTVLWRGGRVRSALELRRRSVAVLREAHGDGDARTLLGLGRLAFVEAEMGSLLDDPVMLRRARDRAAGAAANLARGYGDEHFEVMEQHRAEATALCALGDHAAAERLLRRVARAFRESLGEHPTTVAAETLHATALARLGETGTADAILRRGRELYERLYGPGHPYVAEVLARHGPVLAAMGDADAAAGALVRARRIYEERYGPEHPRLIPLLTGLAELSGRPDEAAELRERADRIRRRL